MKNKRKYLLFVNLPPNKGVYFFVRVLKELWERRPEIQTLVVEGSAGVNSLYKFRTLLKDVKNVNGMENTTRPSSYYEKARATLVPSLFDESFGRVAAESLISGAPVIASNRGALPETLGDGARLLEIPSEYTPDTKIVPPTNVVKPWIEELERLWDDNEYYAERQQKGWTRAERWTPDRIAEKYDACLQRLIKN